MPVMNECQRTISPIDGSVVAERPYTSSREIAAALEGARAAQAEWRWIPLAERASLVDRFVNAVVARTASIAEEITAQIGRPIAHSPGELRGFEERSLAMIDLAV